MQKDFKAKEKNCSTTENYKSGKFNNIDKKRSLGNPIYKFPAGCKDKVLINNFFFYVCRKLPGLCR